MHVGVRGADRAIAVCDRLRALLPELLAISANSPFLDGARLRAALRAHADLHEELPALRDPRAVRRLAPPTRTTSTSSSRRNSIVEHTQLWWSVRPHHASAPSRSGSATRRRRAEDSTALAGADRRLRRAGRARLRRRARCPSRRPAGYIEENIWRAIRYGLDGTMIDLERGEEFRAAALPRPAARLDGAGARAMLGIDPALPARERRPAPARGARRRSIACEEVYAAEVALTQRTLRERGGEDVSDERAERGGDPRVEEQLKQHPRRGRAASRRLVTLVEPRRRAGWACRRAEDARDLDQAQLAIEGARALLPLMPEEELGADPGAAVAAPDGLRARGAGRARAAEPGAAERAGRGAAGRRRPSRRSRPTDEAERAKARSKIWTPPGT